MSITASSESLTVLKMVREQNEAIGCRSQWQTEPLCTGSAEVPQGLKVPLLKNDVPLISI